MKWFRQLSVNITLLSGLLPSLAYSAAWTLDEGEEQHFITYRYYSTDSFFDRQGNERDKRGEFTKNEINYYAEYGWNADWTIGTSLFLTHEEDRQRFDVQDPVTGTFSEQQRTLELQGLSRADVFARYQVYRDDTYAVAVQPLLTLPPAYVGGIPSEVTQEDGAIELGVLAGRNFELFGRKHYADSKLAYRHRFGDGDDQYILEALAGLSLADDWTLIPELQYTDAVGGIDSALTTIAGQNDYRLFKLQLSALYQITDGVGIQAGGFRHVSGRNTGAGGGGLLSLWLSF